MTDAPRDVAETWKIKGKSAIFNFWFRSVMEKGATLAMTVFLLSTFSQYLFHSSIPPFAPPSGPPSP